jgi:hypothetical protein
MSIRIPRSADVDVQAAFRDVEQQLDDLAAKGATGGVDPSADLASLVARIEQLEKRPRLDSDKDVFVAAGSQHSAGLVPDPGTYTGGNNSLLANGAWGNPDLIKLNDDEQNEAGTQDIYALPGSLHVSGSLSAGQATVAQLHQMNPSFCRVYKSANVSPGAQDQFNVVTWDLESFDSEGMHDNVTNNSRITIVNPGLYVIATQISSQQAGVVKWIAIYKNGSLVAQEGGFIGGNVSVEQQHAVYLDFAGEGAYYEVFTYFGTALTVNTTSWFGAFKVA